MRESPVISTTSAIPYRSPAADSEQINSANITNSEIQQLPGIPAIPSLPGAKPSGGTGTTTYPSPLPNHGSLQQSQPSGMATSGFGMAPALLTCLVCGTSLFPGQFRCAKCGAPPGFVYNRVDPTGTTFLHVYTPIQPMQLTAPMIDPTYLKTRSKKGGCLIIALILGILTILVIVIAVIAAFQSPT